MLGDESLMFSKYSSLTKAHQKHVEEMRSNILVFAMSILPISKKNDRIILDKLFLEKKDFFDWHKKIFLASGLDFSDKIYFVDEDDKYDFALKKIKKILGMIK